MAGPNWLQQIVDRAGLELALINTAPGSDTGQIAIPVRVISQLGGGGGGGAPTDALYVVGAAHATLTAELVLGADVIMRGTLAARPAFGTAGRLYYVTDAGDQRWTRDTGAAWEDCPPHYSELLGVPTTFAPAAHASSHQHAGADEVATATPAANVIPKAGAGGTLASGFHPVIASGDHHSEYVQEALVDAKGDLIVATAADTPARLAVGTNDQVLTADSAQATGVKWAAAAGGGGKVTMNVDFKATSGDQWANMPAAETVFHGALSGEAMRWRGDLDTFDRVRFLVGVRVVGATGATLSLQYSTDGSAWTDVTGCTLAIDAAGFIDSGWQVLNAAAQVTDVHLRIVGEGGDGVVDPQIARVSAVFSS